MKIRKFTATAMLSIAATVISGGIAHADSASTDSGPSVLAGSDHGVSFQLSKSEDTQSVSATLNGGTFSVHDGVLTVSDNAGAVVSSVPLTLNTTKGELDLQASVTDNGTHLTATPIARWLSQRNINTEIGFGIGATVGMLIGMVGLVGFGILALVTMPIGFIIGGAIGAGIGGALPASDVPDILELNCYGNVCG